MTTISVPTLINPDLSTLGAQLTFILGLLLAAIILEWVLRKHLKMGLLGLFRRAWNMEDDVDKAVKKLSKKLGETED